LEAIDLHGKYPDGTRNKKALIPKNSYHLLNTEYKSIVDYYAATEVKRLKESTVYGNKAIASSVFLKLQQSGVKHLAAATEENILSSFIEADGKIERHYSATSKFARVLKTCAPAFPECENVLALLPAFRARRKNIQYLTPGEYAKVKEALISDTSSLSLRNKAIGLLLIFTGLRGCDIVGLKLNAIDWDGDVIHIRQQKTGVPQTLPLSAIVGNAIHDYIEHERPNSDCEYAFITQQRPFGRIQRMGAIAASIMKAANIRQSKGDRKGAHIFRHRLATKLLENGIPRPVISSITGQTCPKSLDPYLSTAHPHLKYWI
jgi:integrase